MCNVIACTSPKGPFQWAAHVRANSRQPRYKTRDRWLARHWKQHGTGARRTAAHCLHRATLAGPRSVSSISRSRLRSSAITQAVGHKCQPPRKAGFHRAQPDETKGREFVYRRLLRPFRGKGDGQFVLLPRKRTDEQPRSILHETANWHVNGRAGRVLCVAPTLRQAIRRAAEFAMRQGGRDRS